MVNMVAVLTLEIILLLAIDKTVGQQEGEFFFWGGGGIVYHCMQYKGLQQRSQSIQCYCM